jgi:hypothetical protein
MTSLCGLPIKNKININNKTERGTETIKTFNVLNIILMANGRINIL